MFNRKLLAGVLTAILPFQVLAGAEGLDLLEKVRVPDKTEYLSGWVQTDAAWYNSAPAGLMDDGAELRRGILNLQANIHGNVGYKIQFDFANAGKSGLKDAYIVYRRTKALNFKLGNSRDPFMLQDQISSRYTLFTERALPEAFTAGRHLGLVTNYYEQDWMVSGGLFGSAANTTEDTERDRDWGVSARTTFAPVNHDDVLMHLGFSANYRDTHQLDSVSFSQQPETHIAGVNFVDTGDITSSQNTRKIGMEISAMVGPWSIQTEYLATSVDRSNSGGDLNFNGWYAQGGYFFTGEHRHYDKGTFIGVKPNHSVGNGGIGAWQLGLRFSTIDLTDRDINGGEMSNLTVGLNWYPTDDIRVSANYINVLQVDGGPQDGIEPDIFQIRFQWEFNRPLKNIVDKFKSLTD